MEEEYDFSTSFGLFLNISPSFDSILDYLSGNLEYCVTMDHHESAYKFK